MRLRARYCGMVGVPFVALLASWWALRSAGTAYDRVEVGMNKDEVRTLLGEPSRSWTASRIMVLPDRSIIKDIRNVEEWDRIHHMTTVQFEDDRVVEKSRKGFIAKFHDQALNLLHWRRAGGSPYSATTLPAVVPAGC